MDEYIILTDTFEFDDKLQFPFVLVYFFDNMNVQCRGFDAIIEEVAQQAGEETRVLSVDVEQSPELAYRYGIDTVPYVLFFRNGEVIAEAEGANLPEVYLDIIENYN